jgi:hypothetical protein
MRKSSAPRLRAATRSRRLTSFQKKKNLARLPCAWKMDALPPWTFGFQLSPFASGPEPNPETIKATIN